MSGVHASAEISTQRLWRRQTEGPARGVILQQLSGLSETTSLYAGCRQDCSFPTAAALPAKSRSQWGSERLAESDGHTLLVAHAWFVSDLSVLPTKPIVQCLSVCFPQLFFLVGETQKILYQTCVFNLILEDKVFMNKHPACHLFKLLVCVILSKGIVQNHFKSQPFSVREMAGDKVQISNIIVCDQNGGGAGLCFQAP